MNLHRIKELLAAWEAGAAREDELAELRRLLPAVIEAAEVLPKVKASLRFALDEWEYAAQYKGEYLSKKHGDAEDIAEHRSVLANAP